MGALAQLAASALAMLRTRLELASVEFAEAREHIKEMVLLAAVGIVLGLFALLFASLFVIAYFWDEYRLEAVGGVTLFYVAITVLIFARLRKISREALRPASLVASAIAKPAALVAIFEVVAPLLGLRRYTKWARLASVAFAVSRIARQRRSDAD